MIKWQNNINKLSLCILCHSVLHVLAKRKYNSSFHILSIKGAFGGRGCLALCRGLRGRRWRRAIGRGCPLRGIGWSIWWRSKAWLLPWIGAWRGCVWLRWIYHPKWMPWCHWVEWLLPNRNSRPRLELPMHQNWAGLGMSCLQVCRWRWIVEPFPIPK